MIRYRFYRTFPRLLVWKQEIQRARYAMENPWVMEDYNFGHAKLIRKWRWFM